MNRDVQDEQDGNPGHPLLGYFAQRLYNRVGEERKGDLTTERSQRSASVVLLYHRLGMPKLSSLVAGQYVAPVLFRSQLDYLTARGWGAVSLADMVERSRFGKAPPRNEFAITFDDGYASVYRHAFPVLRERGMTATVYVVAGHIDGINEWDWTAGDRREDLMTAAEIIEMSAAGFEIGSHTLTHPHLTDLNEEQLQRELIDSKHTLEDLIGREVSSLSYPYGDYDDRVLAAAIVAGYKYAVSARLGTAGRTSIYEIPRINVRWNAIGPFLLRKIGRARRAQGVRK